MSNPESDPGNRRHPADGNPARCAPDARTHHASDAAARHAADDDARPTRPNPDAPASPRRPSMRIAIPCAAIALIVILAAIGSIASLGRELSGVHWALGATFWALVALCLIAGVAWPLMQAFSRPVFGLWRLREGSEGSRRRSARMLTENLAQRADISPEQRTALAQNASWEADQLATFFKESLEPAIDHRIKTAAKASFFSTAISQNPAFDMISALAANMRMVRGIVGDCGFRPSAAALASLYARVMKAAVAAGGIEELDYGEIVALIGGNAALSLPGAVAGSLAQGAANAFLTVRVGIIAKEMLFSEHEPDPSELRRRSYGEALDFLRTCGLAEDLRAALARQAAKAASGAASKVADWRDDMVHRAAEFGSGLAEQAAEIGDAAAQRTSRLKDSIAERIDDAAEWADDAKDGAAASAKRAVERLRPREKSRAYTQATGRKRDM